MFMKSKKTESYSIRSLYTRYNSKKLELNPTYQRNAVWTLSQKQLFIDSIIREIDIPKIYFRLIGISPNRFEVVDGQQRLRTIFEYMDEGFALSNDSDKIGDKSIANLTYKGLDLKDLQMDFDDVNLDIAILSDYTDDDVEEMFLRLQNGTTLNAPEKRRALNSDMRTIVSEISKHKIFNLCAFNNNRYGYEDAVSKILHIMLHGSITDIKPVSIKKTYMLNAKITNSDSNVKKLNAAFNLITDCFGNSTNILKKYSIITLTYVVVHLIDNYNIRSFKKELAKAYLDFELLRVENEELDESKQDSELAAYSDAARSDSVASMKYRHDILLEYIIESIPDLKRKDKIREFTKEQRAAIYHRDGGVCKICKTKCTDDSYHADHIVPHSKGGETKLSNSQLLCPTCNLKKGGS